MTTGLTDTMRGSTSSARDTCNARARDTEGVASMQDEYTPAWGDGPAPLSIFSPDEQRAIAEAVAQPTPPPRWLDLGLAQITSRAWIEWHRQRGIDPYKRREKIPAWMRERVIERDGLTCGICDGPVTADDVHIDHIHPVALGGRNEVDNLQVAHSRCNLSKGAKA